MCRYHFNQIIVVETKYQIQIYNQKIYKKINRLEGGSDPCSSPITPTTISGRHGRKYKLRRTADRLRRISDISLCENLMNNSNPLQRNRSHGLNKDEGTSKCACSLTINIFNAI